MVVLNEPRDKAITFPLSSNVALLWQPLGHSYAARNLGLRHASGDLIAFTDSDTVPAPLWIERAVAAFRGGVALVAGRIELTFVAEPLTPSACYEKLFSFDQRKNADLGRSVTANLVVSASVFRKYGLFRDDAITGEDFDWTKRATDAGEEMVFGHDVVVAHPARESLGELIRKARRDGACPEADQQAIFVWGYGLRRWSNRYLRLPSAERRSALRLHEIVKAVPVAIVVQFIKLVAFLRCAARSSTGASGNLHPSRDPQGHL
jgi:glycosyltransferase involved in cell wall biosynthesis